MAYPVSKQVFGELVERALADVPEPFASHLEEISVEVRARPSPRELKRARLVSGGKNGMLLGLYVGHPMTRRSVEMSGQMPDVIYVFQENIELVANGEAELVEQIRITVLHEIGHHFGMSEDDLDDVGYG